MTFFTPLRPLLKGWGLSFLGWGLVGCALAADGVTTRGDSWVMHLEPSLRAWLPWAFFTPLIFLLVARLPLERGRWKAAIPVHLVVAAAVLLASQWWKTNFPLGSSPGEPRARGGPPSGAFGDRGPGGPPPRGERGGPPPEFSKEMRPPPQDFSGGGKEAKNRNGPQGARRLDLLRFVSFDLPIYLMLLTGAHAVLFFRRDQERAASLAKARLDALRMQLQPHFLFNTLNTIGGLVHDEPDKADALLTSLSDLLRLSLETSTTQQVTLAREIEFVERYLAIMHARFEDRLRFEIEVAPEARAALVPPMVLQPLVENAVEHGLQPKPEGGIVRIRARREGDNLRLEVVDDGAGVAAGQTAREGVGLGNTRARLRELYGDRAKLEFSHGNGFTVAISLPFHTESAT